MSRTELDEIEAAFSRNPGLRGKSALKLVTDVLGPTDWLSGPGDDAALLPGDGSSLLVAGEALWPPFVEKDPYAAGIAAVVTNVNDIVAMGGRPLCLVDTIVGSERVARRALEGMRFGSELYGVPIVGGHFTLREDSPAVSAFVAGRVSVPLSARNVAHGQVLLVTYCLDGEMREDFPFFSSLRQRGTGVRSDIELLAREAEAGLCVAAKDVSMAGLLGTIAMLLEGTGAGITVDVGRVQLPDGVSLSHWVTVFPSFGFLLACRPETAEECRRLFLSNGMACEMLGTFEGSGQLRVRLGGQEALLLDLGQEHVTGLARSLSGRDA